MSERNGSPSPGSGTAEIPVVRPTPAAGEAATPPEPNVVARIMGPWTAEAPQTPQAPRSPEGAPSPQAPGSTAASGTTEAPPAAEASRTAETPAPHATAPVTVRPKPRMPRRGPLTVMGPWAPVAGGLFGLVLGVVAVLLLAGTAESFEDRLALVFTVLGLGMLGAAGVLLADEVRMLRQRAREAAVRPQWVEATAGLINGLTPARLLLLVSGFVLFLAAFVSRA